MKIDGNGEQMAPQMNEHSSNGGGNDGHGNKQKSRICRDFIRGLCRRKQCRVRSLVIKFL